MAEKKRGKTKFTYFQLLMDTFKEIDLSYLKIIALEILFVLILSLLIGGGMSLFSKNLEPLLELQSLELVSGPEKLLDLNFNPNVILFFMLIIPLVAVIGIVLNFTITKGFQYPWSMCGKASKVMFKKFLFFNIVYWLVSSSIVILLMIILVFTYLLASAGTLFVYLNLFFGILIFFIILGFMYMKCIGNIILFDEEKSNVKKMIKTSLKVHYFIPYLIVVFILFVLLFWITNFSVIVQKAVLICYMLFTITFTRKFFIKLVRKING